MHLHKTVELLYPFLPSILMPVSLPSLLTNVLCSIFFSRIGHFICIKNLFRQTSFLLNDICNASGNSSAASVDRSCFSCYLDVLKPNYFLKLSNHLLLELNSPALEPSPSFCFKLSYNNFDFSLITLGPIRMSFLEPSCAQIKAVLSMR